MKTTKRALFSSVVALILCFSMLVGTTFAWFTDEVESGMNTIVAGNLDVELEYAKVVNGNLTSWDTVAGKTEIFDRNAKWEPGRVEIVYLRVSNLGNLDLKYQLGVNFEDTVIGETKDGKEIKLSQHLVFKVVNVEQANGMATYTDREAVAAAAGTELGIADYKGNTTELKPGEFDYVALIVYMPETVGNEANYKTGTQAPSIELGINLYATQMANESDSFGPDYDEGANHESFLVTTANDLQNALNEAQPGAIIEVVNDIVTDEPIVIPAAAATFAMRSAPAPVVLNLNGKTVSNPNGYVVENYGNVVITGSGTLTGLGIIRSHGGSVVIENGNFYASSRWQDGVYQHTLKAENTIVTINGGNFDATVNGQTNAMLNASENAVITINGGSFKNVAGELTAFDPYIFTYEKNGAVVINDGTFYGGWRFNGETATTDIYGGTFTVGFDGQSFHAASTHVVTVYGGTFCTQAYEKLSAQLDNIVADGFKVVETNDKHVVVSVDIDSVVSTPAGLKNALSAAAAAGAGDNTIYLVGDFDLTDTDWTPVNVDGYNGAGVVTIEGNGATIKGLTAPLFAGGFAGKSGIVIKNLTIADSNIVSTSGLGGGAFIDSADSMHIITLENCHLVNSTVSGERVGGLIGWCTGYAKQDDGPVKAYVTINNCSVVDSTVIGVGSAGAIAGHPGASDWTWTTIENCTVKNVDVISYEPISSWRTGAIVGTANNGHVVINDVTVKDVTLTQDGVTATETKLFGRFVPAGTGTLVIDGATVVNNADELAKAVANDVTNIYLADGEYNVANCGGKTLTITGSKNAVLKIMNEGEGGADYGFDGSTVTFNGITVNTTENAGSYKGYARMIATFNNCAFVGGGYTTFSASSFNNCTFDIAGYIWTWGATTVNFTECTFVGDSRAILAHGSANTVITIKDCNFAATTKGHTGAGDWTAVVEIDPIGTNSYTINFEGENTISANYSGWTRVKDDSTGHVIKGLN